MFDYKLVEAMATVVLEGGFERAANKLHLTQSAVSQRVKLLETQAGSILLVRSNPPQPTAAGTAVMRHYQQVVSLEREIAQLLDQGNRETFVPLSIGINADSLATWFFHALFPWLERHRVTLDLRVDDQEQTLRHLKAGKVMGCISSHSTPVQGCAMHPLATMRYRLVSSPSFFSHWFARGVNAATLSQAPAVIFNRKDTLHARLLEQIVPDVPSAYPLHYVPSAEQFVEIIRKGLAYGGVPDMQGRDKLASGELVELVSNRTYAVRLYWHVWSHRSSPLEQLTEQLLRAGREVY